MTYDRELHVDMAEIATLVLWYLLGLKGSWFLVPSVEPKKPVFCLFVCFLKSSFTSFVV